MKDLHMHTCFSDGNDGIKTMVAEANRLGLKKIAITDHIWRSSEWFDLYCQEIHQINSLYEDMDILVGFEAKALSVNGEIDVTDQMCMRADIRLGAMHRIPKGEMLNLYFSREEIAENQKVAYVNWVKTTCNMIRNKNVDIVAHPCMVLNKYQLEIQMEDLYKIFVLALQYSTKLEVSGRYKKSNRYLFDIVKENPSFCQILSFGSDAHSIEELKKSHNV